MDIKVNGEQKKYDQETILVTDLLKSNNVEMPEMVSVQINGEFVDKEVYSTTTVKNSDEVDFLYFMGGGQ